MIYCCVTDRMDKSCCHIPILRNISHSPLISRTGVRTWLVESTKGAVLLVLRPPTLPDKVLNIHQAMGPIPLTLPVHVSGGSVELHGVVEKVIVEKVDDIMVLLNRENLQQVTRSSATTWTELAIQPLSAGTHSTHIGCSSSSLFPNVKQSAHINIEGIHPAARTTPSLINIFQTRYP